MTHRDSINRPSLQTSVRDDFSANVKRVIASRVGWRCSNLDCRASCIGPTSSPDRASNVGVAAHITAASPGGPRFDPAIEAKARRSAGNGIWLCSICAKMVDDDPQRYTALCLRFWKGDAEDIADQEKGRPSGAPMGGLRFAAIRVDPSCMWRPSHRLGKIAARLGAMPDVGFHEIPQQAWQELGVGLGTHSVDPIFDLTFVNDAPATTVISSVGFEAHSMWADLKGLPGAYKIPVIDAYALAVAPIIPRVPQVSELPDPIAIASGQTARIKLALARFRENLSGNNETLIRLRATANGNVYSSRLINMGVY